MSRDGRYRATVGAIVCRHVIAELGAQERGRAAPLFAGLDYHLAVAAVLSGEAEGTVYADSGTSPRSGLLHTGHRVYLAGDAGDGRFLAAGKLVLQERIIPPEIPPERAGGEGRLTLYYDDPAWHAAAEPALCSGQSAFWGRRRYYHLGGLSAGWQPPVALAAPEGFSLHAVDGALAGDTTLEHRDELLEEMRSERASAADFLARSFGMVLLRGRAVAGWCLSEYNLGRRCEVGIATAELLRRRGLATLTGAAFIRQAIAAGVSEIGWHCWADNVASCATAQRLGFALVREYPACVVRLSR
jgi:RimJ/RimL family protein N-acetyltransferase